jgi:hypothetical protein
MVQNLLVRDACGKLPDLFVLFDLFPLLLAVRVDFAFAACGHQFATPLDN